MYSAMKRLAELQREVAVLGDERWRGQGEVLVQHERVGRAVEAPPGRAALVEEADDEVGRVEELDGVADGVEGAPQDGAWPGAVDRTRRPSKESVAGRDQSPTRAGVARQSGNDDGRWTTVRFSGILCCDVCVN